jgi:hypothetical protein
MKTSTLWFLIIATIISNPLNAKGKSMIDRGPDIPPVGRSAFDHLLALQDAPPQKAVVPYPFDQLIALINKQIKTSNPLPISVLFVPFGRSLQRFAAEPDFFKYPRIIVAVNEQSEDPFKNIDLHLQSKLYIGYVESSDMLEVISYNEELARFEFQIVKNYGKGKRPEVFYASRRLCMTCHEAGIPIFPNEPWSETNDNELIAEQIIKARGASTYFGFPIKLKKEANRVISEEAIKFDFDVLESGKKQYAQYMLSLICGDEPKKRLDCRATGLKLAMASQFNTWQGPKWNLLQEYQKIMDEFYNQHGAIQVPFPFLADRDPVNNADVFGTSQDPAVKKLPFKNMKKNIDLLRKNITELPPIHDPKKSRLETSLLSRLQCHLPHENPPIPYQKYCNLNYFIEVFTTRDLMIFRDLFSTNNTFDFKKFEAVVDKMYHQAKYQKAAALAQNFMQRNLLLKEMISLAKPGINPELCCQKPIQIPPKVLPDGIQASSLFDPNIKALFKHCGTCHSQPMVDYPSQFLYGQTEADIKQNIIRQKDLIYHSLMGRKSPMPPLNTEEHKTLKQKTRQELGKFIQTVSPDL